MKETDNSYIMDRTEYMQICGDCLTDEDCVRLFDRNKKDLMEDTAQWNQALEVAYNEYVWESQYD